MIEMSTLKKKVKVFFDLQTPVHIVTNSDTWLNGYITKVEEDYFTVLDRKDGETPVFYDTVRLFDFFVGDMDSLKKIAYKMEKEK